MNPNLKVYLVTSKRNINTQSWQMAEDEKEARKNSGLSDSLVAWITDDVGYFISHQKDFDKVFINQRKDEKRTGL